MANHLDKRLMREALKWRAIIDNEHVSHKDRAAYEFWLAEDPAHEAAMLEAERFWGRLDGLKDLPLERLEPSHSEVDQTTIASSCFWRRRGPIALGAAACVLIAVGIMVAREIAQPPRMLKTRTAEVRTEVLKDGSEVVLGAKSTVRARVHRWRRSAEVLSGSAFFVIAKDTRPFTVLSGRLEIAVTGTQFAVHRSKFGTMVSVAEGSVDVSDRADAGEVVMLEAGGRVTSTAANRWAVSRVPGRSVGAWRRNRLVYEEEPIGKLIDDLNRYRDRPIVLADPRLRLLTITANFDASEIEQIPSALQSMFALEAMEMPDRTVMRRRSED